MKKGYLNNFFEFLSGSKWLMVIYAILSVVVAVLLLIGMPYDKTVILYLMASFFFGPLALTAALFVPVGLLFRIFGRSIPKPLAIFLGNIVNFFSIFFVAGFIPSVIIVIVFYLSLFKLSFFLSLFVLGVSLYLGYGIMSNNKILSTETDIEVIQSFRLAWCERRLKWVLLLFVLLSVLLILGIREHKLFSMIDCTAMSVYLLFVAYHIYISPYRNTYSKEYSKKDFVFFLRSFRIDNTVEEKIISAIHDGLNYTVINKLRILRIGNPSLTMYEPAFGADTFFLPTHDWQPLVRKYINDSRAVVVLINVPKRDEDVENNQLQFTQGVIWELYNNIEYRDKFVYCIEKISSHTSSGYLDLLDSDKKEHSLTKCIISILDYAQSVKFVEDRCIFTYDGEKCLLFDEMKSAVKYTIGQRLYDDETFVEFLIDN